MLSQSLIAVRPNRFLPVVVEFYPGERRLHAMTTLESETQVTRYKQCVASIRSESKQSISFRNLSIRYSQSIVQQSMFVTNSFSANDDVRSV